MPSCSSKLRRRTAAACPAPLFLFEATKGWAVLRSHDNSSAFTGSNVQPHTRRSKHLRAWLGTTNGIERGTNGDLERDKGASFCSASSWWLVSWYLKSSQPVCPRSDWELKQKVLGWDPTVWSLRFRATREAQQQTGWRN